MNYTENSETNSGQQGSTVKLAWRLDEIAQSTGLSVPFLRKEIYAGNLKSNKLGRCVIVLDSDLQEYLRA